MLDAIFTRFVKKSPVSVMARALMERVFAAPVIDELFERYAQKQYTKEVLFSSIVGLMSLVVCGIQKTVSSAYKSQAIEITVSLRALYNKLERVEPQVSRRLVSQSAEQLAEIIVELGGSRRAVVPGLPECYPVRILDGNVLAGTEHRLGVLREEPATPLPGKALVVYAPQIDLVSDIFPCEDGHAQERVLLQEVLETVSSTQLWVGDRNFCTHEFLAGIAQRDAYYAIRQHGNFVVRQCSELISQGRCETGEVFEQQVEFEHQGVAYRARRIVVQLNQVTRDGDRQVVILSNLPAVGDQAVCALTIAALYRQRWSIETLFQVVTENFKGEISTLAYPKAALFSLCLAFCTYNILATVRCALGQGQAQPEGMPQLSDYYLVDEITGNYRGMAIALPQPAWTWLVNLSVVEFTAFLQSCAQQVELKRFLKSPTQAKQKKPKLPRDSKRPHVSTARLLDAAKRSNISHHKP